MQVVSARGSQKVHKYGAPRVKSVLLAWIYILDGRYINLTGGYTYQTGYIHIGQTIYILDRRYTYQTEDIHVHIGREI